MMDTNTLIMSAPLKDLGLTSANNPDIQYRVSATTQYEWGNVSETGWIKYRPFSPKLWFSGDSSWPPPGCLQHHPDGAPLR